MKAVHASGSTVWCVQNLQMHRKCHIHICADVDSEHDRWHLWKCAMNKHALSHRCSCKIGSTVNTNRERFFSKFSDTSTNAVRKLPPTNDNWKINTKKCNKNTYKKSESTTITKPKPVNSFIKPITRIWKTKNGKQLCIFKKISELTFRWCDSGVHFFGGKRLSTRTL